MVQLFSEASNPEKLDRRERRKARLRRRSVAENQIQKRSLQSLLNVHYRRGHRSREEELEKVGWHSPDMGQGRLTRLQL